MKYIPSPAWIGRRSVEIGRTPPSLVEFADIKVRGGKQLVVVASRYLYVSPMPVRYFETIKAISNHNEVPINFDS